MIYQAELDFTHTRENNFDSESFLRDNKKWITECVIKVLRLLASGKVLTNTEAAATHKIGDLRRRICDILEIKLEGGQFFDVTKETVKLIKINDPDNYYHNAVCRVKKTELKHFVLILPSGEIANFDKNKCEHYIRFKEYSLDEFNQIKAKQLLNKINNSNAR